MTNEADRAGLPLRDWQALIGRMYGAKDAERGADATFLWLAAEVGELAEAVRVREPGNLRGEFADVLAWLATLANLLGVDLADAAFAKYGRGCPGCRQLVCACAGAEKP